MGILDSIFGSDTTFTPDYRDNILFNGSISYKATGKIKNDRIEFIPKENSGQEIYLNTNFTAQQYKTMHNRFELCRNNDGSNFSESGVYLENGTYYPTGRRFTGDEGDKLWEMMKFNDPDDVFYMNMPFIDSNYIWGKQCIV